MSTPQSYDEAITAILDKALSEPLGIVVSTENPDTLKRKIYSTIRRCRERRVELYDGLSLSKGQLRTELLIYHSDRVSNPSETRAKPTPKGSRKPMQTIESILLEGDEEGEEEDE